MDPTRSDLLKKLTKNRTLLEIENELNSEEVFLDKDGVRFGSIWLYFDHSFRLERSAELVAVHFFKELDESTVLKGVGFLFQDNNKIILKNKYLTDDTLSRFRSTLATHYTSVALSGDFT
jgi:hypothetical protein